MEILSALILDGERIKEIRDLTPEMFDDPVLRQMYAEYWESDKPIVYTDMMQRAISHGAKEFLVTSMVQACVKLPLTSMTCRQNADVLINNHRKQQMQLILESADVGNDVDASLRATISSLGAMLRKSSAKEKSLSQIVRENEETYFKPNDKPKFDLGIEELDKAIGGIDGGDVVLIAARPAVGKSAFALQIMRKFAKDGKRVAYYNLEMREKQVYERMVSAEGGLSLNRVRMGTSFLNDEERRYKNANNVLREIDNITIYSGSYTVNDIKGEGYDVVIIDYLQLLRSDGKRGGNRYAEVGDISRGIKAIAMNNNIPVIALSQLNRASEGQKDKEPMMADLRESGDLEQDASVILMLWNPDKDDKTRKMIKIEKARQGTTERMELFFDGKHMKFTEWKDADKNPFA